MNRESNCHLHWANIFLGESTRFVEINTFKNHIHNSKLTGWRLIKWGLDHTLEAESVNKIHHCHEICRVTDDSKGKVTKRKVIKYYVIN